MLTRTRPSPRSATRAAVAAAAVALIAAACAPQEEPTVEEPVTEPVEVPEETEEPTAETEEPAEPVEEEPADEAPDDEGVLGAADMLEGDAVTEASRDGEFGTLAVTDVRVATHDGFDRIVFELEGDGVVGWDLRYVDEATSQGSGEPIEVAGQAVLSIALSNLTLPPDLPEDIDRWDEDRVPGTDGVVAEVVHDTIFEGIQTFFAGLDEDRPFLIERFEDPQRVVIDLPHDS